MDDTFFSFSQPTVYFARKIVSGDTIIDNGAIRVEDGIISNVGPKSGIREQGDRIVNLGDMTLVPGFINIHTLLEEAPLRDRLNHTGKSLSLYRSESKRLLDEVRENSDSSIERSVRLTVNESLSNGITTLVTQVRHLDGTFLESLPCHLISLVDTSDISGYTQFSFARKVGEKIGKLETAHGFAAPFLYTHNPKFLKESQRMLHRNKYHFQMHVSESSEELSAFLEHAGPLYSAVSEESTWYFNKERNTPAKVAITNSLIPRHSSIVHPNYCGTDELVAFQSQSATAVISPRFSSFFDLRPFPVATALENRLNIAVSISSPAFCLNMNLLDELYEIRQAHPTIPALELLDMITRNPAKALRMDSELGSLEIGKRANITGIRSNSHSSSPIEDLIQSEISVEFVLINGDELIVP